MSMISIEPFDADFESVDEKGKRHRYQCRVVGIKDTTWDSNKFVVITQGDDGRFGTFDVDQVWPCGSGK
ncbi:MAG: hypothetical protein JWR80_1042 [Bradyrhizobium sp.]|nr:hypothetical protein [Bradyrhizobium sp.]